MQAISNEALPLTATPKGVTKGAFIYVKMAKAKTVTYPTLGFSEYGMANACNIKRGFTPDSTPKGVIQKWATQLTLIYARAPRLKNSVIAHLIVLSEYGMTNVSISSVALPLIATPKG